MEEIALSSLYIFLFILILLSGFFSSSETGLMAINKYRLRHLANKGHRGAKLAQKLLRKPDRLIGLILLGNNLVNIMAASIATVIGIRLFGANGVWIASLALTVVILIFSEVAPKTVAAVNPERIAYPASYVLFVLLKILYPVVWLVNGLANLVLKPFKVTTNADLMEHLNREELRTLVKEGGERIPDDHQRMLVNILDLEQATVEDVMIPRQEIVGIDLNDDWDEILLQLTQTVFTRMPVFRESIDHVEGLLHIRTVIAKLAHGALTFDELKRSVRRPYFIPEGTALTQQLLEFQRRERRMGLVVDEYGDIQGLVTLDDILEEIVGEYTTESRAKSREIRQLDDGNYVVQGTVTVRTLNRTMDWDLPEEDASTINGLMLEELGEIPYGKTSLKVGPHVMTILEIQGNVIGKVLIKPDWTP
ncbi:MAG: HlyC/CorC family transporter [Xanthomonadales bacterium]|nr:HlyC/CorC family transporter [Gammaproteobacteria bacterium]MBT8053839.1 HlyC/CorC family transporter [Gammaproteobacteria bacterium]NND56420.1 HlyC/CorC family transporter [Xanthomonadales bacterium]NNK51806.1 HlyC/CorC family transporter [Xanthomonadales bacterium]